MILQHSYVDSKALIIRNLSKMRFFLIMKFKKKNQKILNCNRENIQNIFENSKLVILNLTKAAIKIGYRKGPLMTICFKSASDQSLDSFWLFFQEKRKNTRDNTTVRRYSLISYNKDCGLS